jgi:hypothetical protein
MATKNRKGKLRKKEIGEVWTDEESWTVKYGRLVPRPGHPGKVKSLFRVVGEKLPYESIDDVRRHVLDEGYGREGVYIAHDSMGCPRYIGRGYVFARLKARKKQQDLELKYFSFYIVKDKKHEREIETLLIRAAGPLLSFNERKKRVDIEPGAVRDYEAGTWYYQRRWRRGAKPK